MNKIRLLRMVKIFSLASFVFVVGFLLGGENKEQTLAQGIASSDGESCYAKGVIGEPSFSAENKTKELFANCGGFLE